MSKKNRTLNSIIIILTTSIIGIFNTLMIRPEDIGTWKNYIGYLFLLIAIVNIVVFVIRMTRK